MEVEDRRAVSNVAGKRFPLPRFHDSSLSLTGKGRREFLAAGEGPRSKMSFLRILPRVQNLEFGPSPGARRRTPASPCQGEAITGLEQSREFYCGASIHQYCQAGLLRAAGCVEMDHAELAP